PQVIQQAQDGTDGQGQGQDAAAVAAVAAATSHQQQHQQHKVNTTMATAGGSTQQMLSTNSAAGQTLAMLGGGNGGAGAQLIGNGGLNMDDSMAATNSSRQPYDTPERRPSIRMRQGGGLQAGGVVGDLINNCKSAAKKKYYALHLATGRAARFRNALILS
ncbi:hypothetical protein ACLKA6_007799, partial [Drosophila palustris]